jgi:hypothetical protein
VQAAKASEDLVLLERKLRAQADKIFGQQAQLQAQAAEVERLRGALDARTREHGTLVAEIQKQVGGLGPGWQGVGSSGRVALCGSRGRAAASGPGRPAHPARTWARSTAHDGRRSRPPTALTRTASPRPAHAPLTSHHARPPTPPPPLPLPQVEAYQELRQSLVHHEAAKHALSTRCAEAEARLAAKAEECDSALHQARAIQVRGSRGFSRAWGQPQRQAWGAVCRPPCSARPPGAAEHRLAPR